MENGAGKIKHFCGSKCPIALNLVYLENSERENMIYTIMAVIFFINEGQCFGI